MYVLVFYHVTLLNECLTAHVTALWDLPLCKRLCYNVPLYVECLNAHITAIQVLTTKDVLVFYHVILLKECLTAHITALWALTTM
jgi:hypothetical protein